MSRQEFEDSYQATVHKHLLTKNKYYLFRARVGEVDYWKYLKEGKTLDFGCGLGQFIFLHKDTAIGAEISNFALKFCKSKGLRVYNSRKLPKGKFDNILCIHALEHLNPREYIRKFKNLLKKNGKLLLVLPYPIETGKEHSFKKGDAIDYSAWNLKNQSGRRYIKKILKDNGFRINGERFNYHGGYFLLYKLPFKIGYRLLKLFNFLRNSKEYVLLATKD